MLMPDVRALIPAGLPTLLRRAMQAGRWTAVTTLLLTGAFLLGFGLLWIRLPAEGVKLHATIDTGIDLYGNRVELLWILALAIVMVGGNTALALSLRRTSPFASALLVGATIPLLLGFLGAVAFIASLNQTS